MYGDFLKNNIISKAGSVIDPVFFYLVSFKALSYAIPVTFRYLFTCVVLRNPQDYLFLTLFFSPSRPKSVIFNSNLYQ